MPPRSVNTGYGPGHTNIVSVYTAFPDFSHESTMTANFRVYMVVQSAMCA